MENKQNRKPSYSIGVGGIMMRIAAALLCLVLISIHLMSGMYAKYSTTGRGDDSARVANFDVEITGEETDLEVTCRENKGAYTITVNNKSEVAVAYTISVTADTPLIPDLDSNTGTLPVGPAGNVHTLTFSVNDWSAITRDMTGENGEVFLGFTVTVNVVQID